MGIPRLWVGISLFAACFAAARTFGQATPPPPADSQPRICKVLHLHVRGDLDSLRLARDFAKVVAEGRADGVEVVLLELSGDRWRADVIHAMAKALRDGQSPGAAPARGSGRVFVLLDDETDRRVGLGQASLALLADASTMTPKTRLVFGGPDDLRETASPETDWERVDRELQGLLYLAARDRQADVMLTTLLPRPSGPLWAVPAAGASHPWRLVQSRPDGGASIPIVPPAPEGQAPQFSIDLAAATRLGIVTSQAKDVGQLLASQNLRARPILRKELSSGLEAARMRIARLCGQLDDALRAIDIDLNQAGRLRGQDAPRRKREAGTRGIAAVAEAERHLFDAEALMIDYPELLAGLPPGRTPVGQEPEDHPTLWRWRFQDFRDEVTRLRGEAESLARTP